VAKIKITWVKSTIGYKFDQAATIKALGFKKLNQSVIQDDSSAIRGMILKVRHLVVLEEVI
jgi:large subunit ribosomal protein L30